MRPLVRLLVVAFIAGVIATMIVQRDRLRQMDKDQLARQIRDTIESKLPKRATSGGSGPTAEILDQGLDEAKAVADQVQDAAGAVAEEVQDVAKAVADEIEEATS